MVPGTLSIVVFGPGHGESIVVVLPDGTAGVVDGCREPTGRDPVSEFVEEMERRRPGTPFRLRFVCMTHPHEDHYRGLGRLLEKYRGRVDHVWRTLGEGDRYLDAWQKYLKVTRPREGSLLPDPDELDGLARIVAEMRLASQEHGARFLQLGQNKRLLNEPIHGHELWIEGCGPADGDLETAHITLLGTLRKLIRGQKPPSFDPNAASGALLVRWGKAGVLLGGDLLCGDGRYKGWEEVHDAISGPVQIVKAAHHASQGAHHEGLLNRLQPDLTIVTPFLNAGASYPPRPDRILHLAQNSTVAITAVPQWGRARASHPVPRYKTPPAGRRPTSGPKPSLAQVPTAGEDDANNAVAVSLNAKGELVGFVLAGKANVYGR
ncbi:MAG TPA: MBL fold metallo-hydrolase [Hyalangium sp.]|nr:MBL fold metallo-hydrolase [Hyalangium sp.]